MEKSWKKVLKETFFIPIQLTEFTRLNFLEGYKSYKKCRILSYATYQPIKFFLVSFSIFAQKTRLPVFRDFVPNDFGDLSFQLSIFIKSESFPKINQICIYFSSFIMVFQVNPAIEFIGEIFQRKGKFTIS